MIVRAVIINARSSIIGDPPCPGRSIEYASNVWGEIWFQRCEVVSGAAEAVQNQQRFTEADAVIPEDRILITQWPPSRPQAPASYKCHLKT